MEQIEKKVCTRCGDEKEIGNFKIYRAKLKDGTIKERVYAQCKTCLNKTQYERRKNNPEAYERLKARGRKRAKRQYDKDPKASNRRGAKHIAMLIENGTFKDKWLQSKYGISLIHYKHLHKKQKGKCFICKTHEKEIGKALVVDHCHTTNQVRGLLCNLCNTAIGFFKEDPKRMRAAIKYLKSNTHE